MKKLKLLHKYCHLHITNFSNSLPVIIKKLMGNLAVSTNLYLVVVCSAQETLVPVMSRLFSRKRDSNIIFNRRSSCPHRSY